jgi:hypothetical protein
VAYQFEDETSELVRQIFLLELLTSDGKGGAATLEGLQIALRVIRGTLFPTSKEDADPFKSDRAQGGMMAFTPSAQGIVMGFSPRAVADGTASKFMKGLAQELRTGLSEVDASLSLTFFAALQATGTPHRSNSRKGSDF